MKGDQDYELDNPTNSDNPYPTEQKPLLNYDQALSVIKVILDNTDPEDRYWLIEQLDHTSYWYTPPTKTD